MRFSEALNVPLYELLPETVIFHNHNNGKGAGVIFGNYIVNVDRNEQIKILEGENLELQNNNRHLEEKIVLLEDQVSILKRVIDNK